MTHQLSLKINNCKWWSDAWLISNVTWGFCQTLDSTSAAKYMLNSFFFKKRVKTRMIWKRLRFKKNQMIQMWVCGKYFPLRDVIRNIWAAKSQLWLEVVCWTFLKGWKPCQIPLSCLHCSEEAGPKWHHLLLWLQPLPVCLRLWLLLPLCWPLLLPRRHPAGSAADPSPRRPHPSALLPWWQLPVHWRAQGEHRHSSTQSRDLRLMVLLRLNDLTTHHR